ncbi:MAG: DUF4340 domain-containing protein [Ardenticatenales bacterium]|nr:DUF4340 domain-containing protein [Ardenticatenales bacterium]
MNRRLTLILFLIFAAMVILAYSLRNETGKQVGPNAPTPTPGPIWALDAKAVSKVEVSGAGNAYTLALVDGKWQVDNLPTNDEVAGVVERTASPSVQRTLPGGRDATNYGFASPTLTVTFTVSETAHTLIVGDPPLTSESDRYVMGQDGTTIYIVSGFDLGQLEDWLTTPPLAPTPTAAAPTTTGSTTGSTAGSTAGTPAADTGLGDTSALTDTTALTDTAPIGLPGMATIVALPTTPGLPTEPAIPTATE